MFTRPNPRLQPVPDSIPRTPRRAAEQVSAIGEAGRWPIGDLYHARLAMIYILSPSHRAVRNQVVRAVKTRYPEYDWDDWLAEKEAGKHRAAANPAGYAPRMFTISAANNPKPTIPYADWRAAVLRAEARKDKKLVRILQAAMEMGAVEQTRAAVARQNPFDFTPKNAGPYLPDMFPYGMGGRTETYDPLPTTPTPAELAEGSSYGEKERPETMIPNG
jgi:hypothetical protein